MQQPAAMTQRRSKEGVAGGRERKSTSMYGNGADIRGIIDPGEYINNKYAPRHNLHIIPSHPRMAVSLLEIVREVSRQSYAQD
jgi:hypothetical protein